MLRQGRWPWRPGWPSWSAAGTLVLVGAGIEPPRFDPNRILLNELVITGAFTYDHGGFERGADAAGARARSRSTRCSSPRTSPLDGLLDAMQGLADGRLAGKVLVRP